jgi:low temperature requirement protein LtrA
MSAGGVSLSVLAIAVGGLLLVFMLWWSYFKQPPTIDHSVALRQAIAWGYSHYFVFAAIAALGAGLQVAIDATHEPVALSPTEVALTVAIPVIVYTVAMGLLHRLSQPWRFMTPFTAVAVILLVIADGAAWFGVSVAVLLMALVLVAFVTYMVVAMGKPAIVGGTPGA